MNLILFEPHEPGKNLSRRDERTIHLLKVLHKKAGDTFDAGILGGMRGSGRIEKINLDGSIFVSLDLRENPPQRLPIRAAVGFPRPIQIRRLLRDLSSLGVEAVDLMGTELGEKSYRDTKLLDDGGARAALVEGAVQSRDTSLPELRLFERMESWLTERPWDVRGRCGGGAPAEGVVKDREAGWNEGSDCMQSATSPSYRNRGFSGQIPLLVAADNVRPEGALSRMSPARRPVVLAIGSERGWSDRERDMLEEAGFLRLSLGARALRTETACVAAVVLVMEKIGALE